MNGKKRMWWSAAGCVLAAAACVSVGRADDATSSTPFEFAVIGDMPYQPVSGGVQVYPPPEYNRLITDLNENKKLVFTVHVGDIKAGNTLCADNVYTTNLALFNTFQSPVIYLPGDNEWTDCHRANNGTYDPIGRLAFLRSIFYTDNQSLGINRIPLTRQSLEIPENVMWQKNEVLFVGLNMPGSNNNRNRTSGDFQDGDAEYTVRNAAVMAWLDSAFTQAASSSIRGLVILSQANPFERFLEPGQGYTVSGYSDFISMLRARTLALGKPVVYVGGDTHYFRVDHPLTGAYPGCTSATPPCVAVAVPSSPTDRVDNLTRVEVFAQNDVHWIKVSVDPGNPSLFSFSPQTVPGN